MWNELLLLDSVAMIYDLSEIRPLVTLPVRVLRIRIRFRPDKFQSLSWIVPAMTLFDAYVTYGPQGIAFASNAAPLRWTR
jgi:hypothetical protein